MVDNKSNKFQNEQSEMQTQKLTDRDLNEVGGGQAIPIAVTGKDKVIDDLCKKNDTMTRW